MVSQQTSWCSSGSYHLWPDCSSTGVLGVGVFCKNISWDWAHQLCILIGGGFLVVISAPLQIEVSLLRSEDYTYLLVLGQIFGMQLVIMPG